MGGVIINFQIPPVVPLRRGGLVGHLVRPTVRPKVVMTPILAELPDGVAEGGPSFLTLVDYTHTLWNILYRFWYNFYIKIIVRVMRISWWAFHHFKRSRVCCRSVFYIKRVRAVKPHGTTTEQFVWGTRGRRFNSQRWRINFPFMFWQIFLLPFLMASPSIQTFEKSLYERGFASSYCCPTKFSLTSWFSLRHLQSASIPASLMPKPRWLTHVQ